MADNILKKPTPQEMAAAKLREIYVRAEREIIREITRKRNLGLVDYEDVASLKSVQEILTRMTTEADEYVPKMIESYFYTAEQIASAAGGYSNAMSLTVAQTSIVEQLVNNLLADIDEAAQTAFKSAEKYLYVGRKEDDIFRKLALELTANKEAGVASRQTVQNMMAAELNAKGVTAFVDKAGREWSLESYCSMATRTTGRQAQVAAALTADDWDLWEIVKIGSTCPLCSAYEGRVYSKSGTDPDYPPLAMAFGKIDPAGSNDLSNTWLNLHPNCEHSLIRYTTAGKTEKQIERMKEFSSFENRPADVDYRSKKQIEAYRNKEAERARYRADVKQFEKYKAAGVEGMPVRFETFEKHKRAGDDVYKGWESKFRSMSAKSSKIDYDFSHAEIEMQKHKGLAFQGGEVSKSFYEKEKLQERLSVLGESEMVSKRLNDGIREIIKHREGTLYEDLGFIDSVSGKSRINKKYDYYDPVKKVSQCMPNKSMIRMAQKADAYTIISFHNHPKNYAPSKQDLNNARDRKYKYGLVLAHNGTIFKYQVDPSFVYNNDVKIQLEKIEKAIYTENRDNVIGAAVNALQQQHLMVEVIL